MDQTESFENISKDVLSLIALKLNFKTLQSLCLTKKRFRTEICNNKDFWKAKLKKDYSNLEISTAKEIYFFKATQNQSIVSVLNELTTYNDYNYHKQKQIYDEFIQELKGVIDKYKKTPTTAFGPKNQNINIIELYNYDYLISESVLSYFIYQFWQNKLQIQNRFYSFTFNDEFILRAAIKNSLTIMNNVIKGYNQIFNTKIGSTYLI